MPDEEKKTVDIDTSGPDATIDIEEVKRRVGCRNRSAGTRNKYTRTSKSRRKETRRKLRRLQ